MGISQLISRTYPRVKLLATAPNLPENIAVQTAKALQLKMHSVSFFKKLLIS